MPRTFSDAAYVVVVVDAELVSAWIRWKSPIIVWYMHAYMREGVKEAHGYMHVHACSIMPLRTRSAVLFCGLR